MKTKSILQLAGLFGIVLSSNLSPLFAQGTAFTYQGWLTLSGTNFEGTATFIPTLWDALGGGSQVASNTTATVSVSVSDGLFVLPLDFGEAPFTAGECRWLQLEVQDGNNFTTLTPRTELTPAPFAIVACTIGSPLSDSLLSSNVTLVGPTIESGEISDGTILGDDIADGTISPADINEPSFSTVFWRLLGNGGTTAGTHFLGTTDPQPLELKVNNQRALRLEPTLGGSPNVIGGSPLNAVASGVVGATISGGGDNAILSQADYAAIGGGFSNIVQQLANHATIGGGSGNLVISNSAHSVIGGGLWNTIRGSAFSSTIVGGRNNVIGTNCFQSTVGGGRENGVEELNIGGEFGTIAAINSTVGGGFSNRIVGADYATIPGGRQNSVVANYGFAAGRRASAQHNGSFVWADSQDADFASTASDQFSIRANGGVRVVGSGGFNSPQLSLHKSGGDHARLRMGVDSDPTWDIAVSGGIVPEMKFYHSGQNRMVIDGFGNVTATAFNPTSDRAAKENFQTINSAQILDKVLTLPLAEWNYKADPGTRHVGPVAQDFHAAFGVGPDDKHIATVDADGVALAAIQGLHQKLEQENSELRQRLERLEQLLLHQLGGNGE